MSEERVEREFPPGWHGRLRRGLFVTASGSFICAVSLFLCPLLMLPVTPLLDADRCLGLATILLLPIGGFMLLLGVWFLARSPIRAGSFAMILAGCVLLLPTTMFASFADELTSLGRIVHAICTLLVLALLVIGVLTASGDARRLCVLLAIDDPLLDRSARRTRTLALITITLLLPSLLSGGGPTGSLFLSMFAIGALFVSISFFALYVLLIRTYRAAGSLITRLAHCPDCGYPRPVGTRCPECGLVPTAQGPDRERT